MATSDALLTAEQFAVFPDSDKMLELVCGRIVSMDLPGCRHGYVCTNIVCELAEYVDIERIGTALCRSGIVTHRNPDSVRGPDVSYYSFKRIPRGEIPDGYPTAPPELIFEVVSQHDVLEHLHAKMPEYLAAGVEHACIVDPDDETVTIYSSNRRVVRLETDAVFTLPDLLPNFAVPIARFFHAQ